MLGLLALTLATLISFNQQRLTQKSYKSTIRDEMELAAAGTAQHVIELIGGRSFDEASTPEKIFGAGAVPDSTIYFSQGDSFGGKTDCDLMEPWRTPSCDDVDDVDGIRGAPINAALSDGRQLQFTADIDVRYVDDPGSKTTASTRTRHKRIDLTVHSNHPSAPITGLLTVSRVVSFDPEKADADMEARCGPIGAGNGNCTAGMSPGSGTIED